MKQKQTHTREFSIATKDGDGAEIVVEFFYYKGDPGVWTFRNGDPGYPATAGEIEIKSIKEKTTGRKIDEDEIEDGEIEEIENALINEFDERTDADEPYYDEDEYKYKDDR